MTKKKIQLLIAFFMAIATLVVLAIAILTALKGDSKPESDSYFQLLGLIFPALIIFAFILIIYWGFKRNLFFLLPLIAIAINFNQILSNIQFRGEGANKGIVNNSLIKIATYNIHEFKYNEELNLFSNIAEFIQSKSLDILCFQEFKTPYYSNENEILGAFDYLPYNYIKEPDKNEIGMAIFSRYPIIRAKKINFEDTGNGLIWADIRIDSSRVIRIINNHLQTTNYIRNINADVTRKIEFLQKNSVIRAHQADVVRAIIDTTTIPVIVCGDFNDIPTSYTFSTIKGENLTDGFREAGSWLGGTFRGMGGLLRIDYILHSKEFKSITYSNPNIDLSDHRPVISELVFRY